MSLIDECFLPFLLVYKLFSIDLHQRQSTIVWVFPLSLLCSRFFVTFFEYTSWKVNVDSTKKSVMSSLSRRIEVCKQLCILRKESVLENLVHKFVEAHIFIPWTWLHCMFCFQYFPTWRFCWIASPTSNLFEDGLLGIYYTTLTLRSSTDLAKPWGTKGLETHGAPGCFDVENG